MMKLSCKELDPSTDCSFVAEGTTAHEVAMRMLDHVKTNHPEAVKGTDASMMSDFESKAHE